MKTIIKWLDGWKSIIGWILMSIPGLSANPMLYGALKKVLEDPSKPNIVEAVIQLILALGIADRIRKNLKGDS